MRWLMNFLQRIFCNSHKGNDMTVKFGKNQGVANALDNYLQQDKPQFAILIDGKWGSGKTWFIRNYIKQKSGFDHYFCYVSLFDIENLKEIDNRIIATCNPILSKAEIVGRFAGSILEKYNPFIKFDDLRNLDSWLKQLYKIPENLVLVLDDLERTKISLELILGYVNNMLDQVGVKVILLCAQEQILKKEEKEKKIFYALKKK